MNDKHISKLKDIYLTEALPEIQVDALWQELAEKLPERQYHPYHYVMRYASLVVILALFLSSGMIAIAAAQPDSLLYPVKLASEHATAKLTGQYDALIQHRTDEIINAAQKKSDGEIQKATEEYQNALEEAEEHKAKKHGSDEELHKTLEDSEAKLRAVTPASEKAQNLIHQSIKATEKTKQEVKGVQTEVTPTPHPDNNQNPSEEHRPESPSNTGNSGENSNQGGQSSEHRNDNKN